jgi:hypothetical protein
MDAKHSISSNNLDKALQNINNIKRIIKQIISKISIEEKTQKNE